MEVLYGLAVGAGVDVLVTPNIFLRAEFEWDQFNPPPGILMTVATARVGAVQCPISMPAKMIRPPSRGKKPEIKRRTTADGSESVRPHHRALSVV